MGHRQLPLATIDAAAGGAEHHVVTGCRPAGLLGQFHLEAMLGEEALLDAHHQRGRFEYGDVAQLDCGGFQLGGGGWIGLGGAGRGPAAIGRIAQASSEKQGGAEGGTEQGDERMATGHGVLA